MPWDTGCYQSGFCVRGIPILQLWLPLKVPLPQEEELCQRPNSAAPGKETWALMVDALGLDCRVYLRRKRYLL